MNSVLTNDPSSLFKALRLSKCEESPPVQQLEGSGDLSVGEAVEGEVGVLGDRVRVVDSWARRSL